jgi:hypothetical protein
MPARFRNSRARSTKVGELRDAREWINRIPERMCRLQETRRVAEPWRQRSLEPLAELKAAVGNAECLTAAVRAQRGPEESPGASCRRSLEEPARATEAMRMAAPAEWAQDYLALNLNP